MTMTEHRGTEAPRQNPIEFLGVSVSRWYVAVRFANSPQAEAGPVRAPVAGFGTGPHPGPRRQIRRGQILRIRR